MTSELTATGVIGPALDLTAQVFSDLTSLNFQIANGTLEIVSGTPPRITCMSLSDIATVTYTISAGVATVTVTN